VPHYKLKEISEVAGVSISTVSRVLAGNSVVSDDSRRRVMAALDQLRAVPRAAGTLPLQGRGIGYFRPSNAPRYGFSGTVVDQTLMTAINEYVMQLGGHLVMGTWDMEGGSGPSEALLRQGRLSGVVFFGTRHIDEDQMRLTPPPVPTVAVNRLLDIPGVHSIGVRHDHVGRLAAQHLLGLGHTRIGTIQGPRDTQTFLKRARGFEQALGEAGILLPPELVEETSLAIEAIRPAVARLLDQPSAPTAVFAGNDRMALIVLQEAQRRGLNVPGDLSVVGVDGLSDAELAVPGLTTVELPWARMGRTAVDMLAQAIADPAIDALTVALKERLIIRESTAPPSR